LSYKVKPVGISRMRQDVDWKSCTGGNGFNKIMNNNASGRRQRHGTIIVSNPANDFKLQRISPG
jgi:hypothetical protein